MNRDSAGNLIPDKIENIRGNYIKALRMWREDSLTNFLSEIRPELLKANPLMTETEVRISKENGR
jgi:hypothetical protein